MADVDNGDILRIGAVMSFDAVYEIANVYHVFVVSGGGKEFAEASLDVQEYMDELYGNIEGQLVNNVAAEHLTMQNVTQNLTFGSFAWDTFAGGTNVNDATALGVCLLAYARTKKPRVQMKKYLGVFSEDVMTDGVWSSTPRAAAEALMDDHVTPFTGTGGLELQGVAYNRTLQTQTVGLSTTTSAEPAYQRRRKRGRGS